MLQPQDMYIMSLRRSEPTTNIIMGRAPTGHIIPSIPTTHSPPPLPRTRSPANSAAIAWREGELRRRLTLAPQPLHACAQLEPSRSPAGAQPERLYTQASGHPRTP